MASHAASPNLPFGEWEFVALDGAEGPEEKTGTSTKGKAYKYFQVKPKGSTNTNLYRRVYPNALTGEGSDLFYVNDILQRSFTGGIFTTNYDGVRGSTASGNAQDVKAGIEKANKDYAAAEAAKKNLAGVVS